MRVKFRNQAFKLLAAGILLILAAIGLVALRKHGVPDGVLAVGAVALGITGAILYIQGCIALVMAKGHNGAFVSAIVIVVYLGGMGCASLSPMAGLIFLPLLFLIPVIVLVGFEDKFKGR